MPTRPNDAAQMAFKRLIANDEVQLIREDDDLHIAGDDWTLVLEGDPVTEVLVALDDEDGPPDQALRDAISDQAFDSMRELDDQLDGHLVAILTESPDILAHSLSEMLEH